MRGGIDRIDRRIVSELRLNGRITNGALAAEVGLSPSACLRRVKLLEQSGVIQGYTAIVGGAGIDDGISAIVQVTLDRQTEEYFRRFEVALQKHPEIREWYLMTGEDDYVLHVRVRSIEDYEEFHRTALSRLPGVSRITSSFAMRSYRRGAVQAAG
jgi:DNA-binding Lrp family transcriptional regulator